jgi:hypothetical protein
MPEPTKSRVNPTRGAPNYAASSHLILSVILRVYSHHDSLGENPIPIWATRPSLRAFGGSNNAVAVKYAKDPLRQSLAMRTNTWLNYSNII